LIILESVFKANILTNADKGNENEFWMYFAVIKIFLVSPYVSCRVSCISHTL